VRFLPVFNDTYSVPLWHSSAVGDDKLRFALEVGQTIRALMRLNTSVQILELYHRSDIGREQSNSGAFRLLILTNVMTEDDGQLPRSLAADRSLAMSIGNLLLKCSAQLRNLRRLVLSGAYAPICRNYCSDVLIGIGQMISG
jgi:hypothetical protein